MTFWSRVALEPNKNKVWGLHTLIRKRLGKRTGLIVFLLMDRIGGDKTLLRIDVHGEFFSLVKCRANRGGFINERLALLGHPSLYENLMRSLALKRPCFGQLKLI